MHLVFAIIQKLSAMNLDLKVSITYSSRGCTLYVQKKRIIKYISAFLAFLINFFSYKKNPKPLLTRFIHNSLLHNLNVQWCSMTSSLSLQEFTQFGKLKF